MDRCITSIDTFTQWIRYNRQIRTTDMGWLRLVGCLKIQVSFAKETYKRDLYSALLCESIEVVVASPLWIDAHSRSDTIHTIQQQINVSPLQIPSHNGSDTIDRFAQQIDQLLCESIEVMHLSPLQIDSHNKLDTIDRFTQQIDYRVAKTHRMP